MNSQIISAQIKQNNYSIYNDNDGFSKWLAYNLGLQMVWNQIQKSNKLEAEKKGESNDFDDIMD